MLWPYRVFIALLIAFILTILPLPHVLNELRPPWVLLLILALQFYRPARFNIFILFIIGLILDALLATVIGEHAFALCLVCLIASNKTRRFSFFSMSQQMTLIGFLVTFYQLTLYFIEAFLGYQNNIFALIGSAMISVLLWPWLRLLVEEFILANKKYLNRYQ